MQILPLKFVHDDDSVWLDKDIVNLAKLYHLGFPVSRTFVVIPPEKELKRVVNKFKFAPFEINQNTLTKEFLKNISSDFFYNELSIVNKPILLVNAWENIVSSWAKDLLHFGKANAKLVTITQKILAQGSAFFDKSSKDSVINLKEGFIDQSNLKFLDHLISKIEKKMYLPFIYHWVIDEGIVNFINVSPLTTIEGNMPTTVSLSSLLERKDQDRRSSTTNMKTPVKIFRNLSSRFKLPESSDGLIIKADKFNSTDEQIFSLVEGAISLPNKPVIFLLSYFWGIKSILKSEIEVLLFARKNKKLLNILLGIPYVNSIDQLLTLKRDLAVLGVSRKGSLKFYLELAIPENFLNIEDYILSGLDGVIINLDKLNDSLIGAKEENPKIRHLYKNRETLIKFLEEPIRTLNKLKIPAVASGQLAEDSDILKFLLDKGIWGINIEASNDENYHDYLGFLQKQVILNRLV